jgi:tetratricopeptide (TPR) repeat protein
MRKMIVSIFLVLTLLCSCSENDKTEMNRLNHEELLADGQQYSDSKKNKTDTDKDSLLIWDGSKYNNPRKVIEYLSKVIERQKNNPVTYNNRGVAYYGISQYQLAIQDYNQAISLRRDFTAAYENRGVAYYKLGQYQLAIQDYNKSISLKQDFTDAYNNRGVAYYQLNRHELAIKDFNRAINLKQDFTNAYSNRGLTYLKLGNAFSGCADMQKACKLGMCETIEKAKREGNCL